MAQFIEVQRLALALGISTRFRHRNRREVALLDQRAAPLAALTRN